MHRFPPLAIPFRRACLCLASCILWFPQVFAASETPAAGAPVKARARLLIVNDFGGDPDGLFQLAQHLLSPTMEIRGIVGSINYKEGLYGAPASARHACDEAKALLQTMRLDGLVPVVEGANHPLENPRSPVRSEGAALIVKEAMRDDTSLPLYIACGAGLTDLASACLLEPKVASRIRLIWIGGPEYEGQAYPPPGRARREYNLGIDISAAQLVFNDSPIPIWQVPRNAYRQALVSCSDLREKLGRGPLGRFLMDRLDNLRTRAGGALGETYVLGDNPLVLLTALESSWEADPSSSDYALLPAPRIDRGGNYEQNPNGRRIRVYTRLDIPLMTSDLIAKIARFDAARD